MTEPAPYPAETVNTIEAAQLMKTHVKTVTEMIGTGELSAGRLGKGYVMLRRDVLALIERRIERDTARRLGVHIAPRTLGALRRSRTLIASPSPLGRRSADTSQAD